MKIVRSLSARMRQENSVVTVGTFDGIHRAHQEIIREVTNRARMREGRSVVVTFDPHPKEVVASLKGEVRLLTTMDERITLFERLGIELLFIVEFTKEFSRLSPREFYRSYIVDGVGVGEVVVGYDHMFGRDREAGVADLVQMGREFDFSVFAVRQLTVDGEAVSSTRIRKALMAGDIQKAWHYLGYPYSVSGVVVPGEGRGRSLGYPTANIQPSSERKIIPAFGVYLVTAQVRGALLYGMLNIGVRPTVTEGTKRTIEVHLFDFSSDLYGEVIEIAFLKRLRDEVRFATVQDLVEQLARDREFAARSIGEYVKQQ